MFVNLGEHIASRCRSGFRAAGGGAERWHGAPISNNISPQGADGNQQKRRERWGFTGNDLPRGVDKLYRTRDKYPWLEMQTLYPFSEDGISRAVADAMAIEDGKIDHHAVAGIGGIAFSDEIDAGTREENASI